MTYRQRIAIQIANENKIIETFKEQGEDYKIQYLTKTGIYVFLREENNIKYAYIGKSGSKGGMLSRMAEHLSTFQRFDISLKKHKLYNKEKNPLGYMCSMYSICQEHQLDEKEQEAIIYYANCGYQLRNQETGGTTGKSVLGEGTSRKTYTEGKAVGRKEAFSYIAKLEQQRHKKKKDGNFTAIALRAEEEFNRLIKGEDNG